MSKVKACFLMAAEIAAEENFPLEKVTVCNCQGEAKPRQTMWLNYTQQGECPLCTDVF